MTVKELREQLARFEDHREIQLIVTELKTPDYFAVINGGRELAGDGAKVCLIQGGKYGTSQSKS